MRIAIVGTGRMGEAVERQALARGHEIVTRVGGEEGRRGDALTADRLAGAEVAIEFTRADVVVANLERLIALGIPTVTGTTGWRDQLPDISARVEQVGGTLLHASNFSIGLQLCLRAAERLAEQLCGRPEFDGGIVETHHAAKRDAPSGTALTLQARVRAADPERAYPITSVRLGHVPGTHRLIYDGQSETIELAHSVRNRSVFAIGAVTAAEWIAAPGRRGVYTFTQMLFEE